MNYPAALKATVGGRGVIFRSLFFQSDPFFMLFGLGIRAGMGLFRCTKNIVSSPILRYSRATRPSGLNAVTKTGVGLLP